MWAEITSFTVTLGVILIIIYSLKKVGEVMKARIRTPKGKEGLTASLPNSLYELFAQMETGLDMQVQSIAERCTKEGKNPIDDVGYKTVLSQYQKVQDLRNKFETNPLYILADSVGWPLVKTLMPDAMSLAKRWMKAW